MHLILRKTNRNRGPRVSKSIRRDSYFNLVSIITSDSAIPECSTMFSPQPTRLKQRVWFLFVGSEGKKPRSRWRKEWSRWAWTSTSASASDVLFPSAGTSYRNSSSSDSKDLTSFRSTLQPRRRNCNVKTTSRNIDEVSNTKILLAVDFYWENRNESIETWCTNQWRLHVTCRLVQGKWIVVPKKSWCLSKD